MLRRLSLKDFVIVAELELDLGDGFTALTGETGAGKSILIDALQLALGNRADAGVVREGATRADISAEFDCPASLAHWLDEAGFDASDSLLLRRTIDTQGKSRAWVNGSVATLTQLREAADHLVDIHGQHAWQSLTRPAAVRACLDGQGAIDTGLVAHAHEAWRQAVAALEQARLRQDSLQQERDRLEWQIKELSKLAPNVSEWDELNAEHRRLAHGQALQDAARTALSAVSDADNAADVLTGRAADALDAIAEFDAELAEVAAVLREAQAQLGDAARSLQSYLGHHEPDPQRLAELDKRLGDWVTLSRRYRRQPAELPALLQTWKDELKQLEAAADLHALEAQVTQALVQWQKQARVVTHQRKATAPRLAHAVTQAMQQLGMPGGRFEIHLIAQAQPQSFGAESVEFLVAGHAGSSPRPLAKVASGGELSRLALAIAASSIQAAGQEPAEGSKPSLALAPGTLIFDEIDAGIGGDVAHAVGRLMKQLGRRHQVLAVTHLAQVAACGDDHWVVSKQARGNSSLSEVERVSGESRVTEIARMLGGTHLAETSRAHAMALLDNRP